MHLVVLALFLAIQQTPTSANSSTQTPVTDPDARTAASASTTTSAAGEADEDRVICRRERVVGSNRPQRVCMTRREWTRSSETSQEQLRDIRGGAENLPGDRGGGSL